MSNIEPLIGQFAKSKAGRDKETVFLIYEVLDEAYVRVVDGESRKVENPKKKNTRHLQLLPLNATEIARKIVSGEAVSDSEIAKAIASLGASIE